MWKLHLVTKRIETGFLDFTQDNIPSQIDTIEFVNHLNFESTVNRGVFLYQFSDGKNIIIGVAGHVKEFLGEEHKFSYEKDERTDKGRPIEFYMAYTAPVGTKIPTSQELMDSIEQDLEELLEKGNQGNIGQFSERVKNGEHEKQRSFDTIASDLTQSDWDKIAKEVETGEKKGMQLFVDGSFREARKPRKPLIKAEQEISIEPSKSTGNRDNENFAMAAVGTALAAVLSPPFNLILGGAVVVGVIYKLTKSEDKKEKAPVDAFEKRAKTSKEKKLDKVR